ncbi:hypothetical protein IMSAGC002_02097 [Lachnospiraceae bacterium]|nr:hypothetical protein IMSAGC002_02097 [Lachnospiraceae bacterium]
MTAQTEKDSPDRRISIIMEETPKELTMKELLELVQRQEGEFIIHIEPGGEETNADAGTGTL